MHVSEKVSFKRKRSTTRTLKSKWRLLASNKSCVKNKNYKTFERDGTGSIK